MKTKVISATIFLFCATLAWLWFSKSTNSDESLLATATTQESDHPGHQTIKTKSAAPQPQGSDKNHPSTTNSLLPRNDLNEMQNIAEETKRLLMSAPDDLSGKQSRWFKPLSDWQFALSKAAKTGTRNDLFALVPTAAAFFARDRETEPLAEPLDEMRHWMQHPAPSIIRELARAAIEGAGSFDDDTASIALQVFTVRGFVSEPDWEDERIPLDAPGMVIALADKPRSLEGLPAKQIARLVQSGDAKTFFRRYEKGGDGLPVLQQQFAEKRQAIVSLFGGLVAKVAAYQASTETMQ